MLSFPGCAVLVVETGVCFVSVDLLQTAVLCFS